MLGIMDELHMCRHLACIVAWSFLIVTIVEIHKLILDVWVSELCNSQK